jgi:hypothetical protein
LPSQGYPHRTESQSACVPAGKALILSCVLQMREISQEARPIPSMRRRRKCTAIRATARSKSRRDLHTPCSTDGRSKTHGRCVCVGINAPYDCKQQQPPIARRSLPPAQDLVFTVCGVHSRVTDVLGLSRACAWSRAQRKARATPRRPVPPRPPATQCPVPLLPCPSEPDASASCPRKVRLPTAPKSPDTCPQAAPAAPETQCCVYRPGLSVVCLQHISFSSFCAQARPL